LLAITIDLVPGGYTPMRRTIASMSILNVSDLAEVSDYRIEAFEVRNPLTGSPSSAPRGVVRAHNRAQSVWALVAKAAEQIMKTDPSNFSDCE
jgi:hypothetical protein